MKRTSKPIESITGRELIEAIRTAEMRHETAKLRALAILAMLGVAALASLAAFTLHHGR